MSVSQDILYASIEFIRRTGAKQVQIRYSDDEHPTIWMVVALYDGKNPQKITGVEVDASTDPTKAALRLAERLCDGGKCTHCCKRTVLVHDPITAIPDESFLCIYQYDPETKKFKRGCEYDGIQTRTK